MRPLQALHDEGQSLWLDHLTRGLLNSGGLAQTPATGVTSNLDELRREIEHGPGYDAAIRHNLAEGRSPEDVLIALLVEDCAAAADLLRPVWERTGRVDGWVSLPLPPSAFRTPAAALAIAAEMRARAGRPNILLEIPGTGDGNAAVERAISEAIPVNVTMLFSERQYRAAAEAFLRGLERRAGAGLDLHVGSVASMSLSAWASAHPGTRAVAGAGVAIGKDTYKAYRTILRSPRWQRLFAAGARPQRLLWESAKTDHVPSEFLTARALAAPFTINALSPQSLRRFAAGGWLYTIGAAGPRGRDGALARLAAAGIQVDLVAQQLQREAASAAGATWGATVAAIASRGAVLQRAG